MIIDNNVILANPSVTAFGSQSVACIGNVLSGKFITVDDKRRTPIWEPHSAKLPVACLTVQTEICYNTDREDDCRERE